MMEKIKPYAPWIVALAAVLVAAWDHFLPAPPAPVGEYTATKEDKAVSGMDKQPVTGGAPVKALPNPTAKVRLGMSKELQSDPSKHVVDTAQFPITYQPFTAVATYDDKTGEVNITAKNDPMPWLAAERRSYMRMGYGVKTGKGAVGQLAVGTNVVQMKSVHIGGSAELFTDGSAYAGVHAEYQF